MYSRFYSSSDGESILRKPEATRERMRWLRYSIYLGEGLNMESDRDARLEGSFWSLRRCSASARLKLIFNKVERNYNKRSSSPISDVRSEQLIQEERRKPS